MIIKPQKKANTPRKTTAVPSKMMTNPSQMVKTPLRMVSKCLRKSRLVDIAKLIQKRRVRCKVNVVSVSLSKCYPTTSRITIPGARLPKGDGCTCTISRMNHWPGPERISFTSHFSPNGRRFILIGRLFAKCENSS